MWPSIKWISGNHYSPAKLSMWVLWAGHVFVTLIHNTVMHKSVFVSFQALYFDRWVTEWYSSQYSICMYFSGGGRAYTDPHPGAIPSQYPAGGEAVGEVFWEPLCSLSIPHYYPNYHSCRSFTEHRVILTPQAHCAHWHLHHLWALWECVCIFRGEKILVSLYAEKCYVLYSYMNLYWFD